MAAGRLQEGCAGPSIERYFADFASASISDRVVGIPACPPKVAQATEGRAHHAVAKPAEGG